jgi:phosphopantothenoylcysteine synthetase/decarboxylase
LASPVLRAFVRSLLGGQQSMNLLVTAGNTLVPLDRVRCITNIFTGRTGASIALHCLARGHTVTLLTSHPDVVAGLRTEATLPGERWTVLAYQTFEDLQQRMEDKVRHGALDVVIHSAAVSDYRAAGIYAPAPSTHFRPEDATWATDDRLPPALVDRAAGKVKSDEPELWLRLVRTPKLIDRVRADWGFAGVLVKFKLEVGIGEERLLDIAERSRKHSQADLMAANTLEGASSWAFLGPIDGAYQRVTRDELPKRLLDAVEQRHRERTHG